MVPPLPYSAKQLDFLKDKVDLKITIFDGARTIGGSKIYLESGNTGIFLDFGINFKKWSDYYEEFLKPRPSRGILDLLRLKLIPPIANIYRKDLFPEDALVELPIQLKLDAIFLSHAHFDHCAHIGLIDPGVPIYSSGMTAMIMKAIQDSGRMDFDREMVYITPRERTAENPKVLKPKTRISRGRKFFLVDPEKIGETMQVFWSTPSNPEATGKGLDSIPLSKAEGTVNDIRFKAFPVDHSVYGATAYGFETPQGWLIYSGDLRVHGERGELTERFVEKASNLKPFALLIEGTNAGEPKGPTEEEVFQNCLRKVKAASGKLVVADFSPRNVERLNAFLQIAKETRRTLVILSKDAYLLQSMRCADGSLPDILSEENLQIFEEFKSKPSVWERRIQKAYGTLDYSEIAKNQGEYILCFSFWDIKHLMDIKPKPGSLYIYSTSEAFTEEREIDIWRLWNWLSIFEMRAVGFTLSEKSGIQKPKPTFVKGYHSSGHISGEELIDLVRRIGPKYLIPVHTENPQFFADELKGDPIRVLLPEEGKPIVF